MSIRTLSIFFFSLQMIADTVRVLVGGVVSALRTYHDGADRDLFHEDSGGGDRTANFFREATAVLEVHVRNALLRGGRAAPFATVSELEDMGFVVTADERAKMERIPEVWIPGPGSKALFVKPRTFNMVRRWQMRGGAPGLHVL